MSVLRLAIVGCGAAARGCHLPALPRLRDGTLSALVDPEPAHAAAALAYYGAQGGSAVDVSIATRVEDALSSFDAAVVVAPHTTHAALAEVLITHGKHVLMEKPMTAGPDQARALAAAVDRAQCTIFAMAHPRRLFPANRWMKNLIDNGTLGELRRIAWREGDPYSWEPTTASMFDVRLAGGGVVTDTGSHVFDLLLWWLGPEVQVVDYVDNSLGGAETDARIFLQWRERGVEADVEFSRLRPLGTSCVVAGDRATATIGTDFPAGRCTLVRSDGTVTHDGDIRAVPPAQDKWEELFTEQLRNFTAAVRGEEEPYSTVVDGLRVVDLIDDCYHGPAHSVWRQPWVEPAEGSVHV